MKCFLKNNKENNTNNMKSIKKGEMKMNNAGIRKHGFKTRIIAVVLAVITIVSAGSAAMTKAEAASFPSTGDKGADIVFNAEYQVGLAAIRYFVPGGSAIAPLLDSIIGSFMPKGLSLSEVNNNINELRSEISTQFAEVKKQIADSSNAIENKIVNQSIISNKGTNFDSMMTVLKATDRQLKSISENDELTEQDKAVEMAYLIGDNADWLKKDNLYFQYEDFLNTLSAVSFADSKDRDLLHVIYDDCVAKVMFSGEAIDKAFPYVVRVTYLGLYAYSMCGQCLKAHQTISNFTEEDIAMLHPEQLARFNKVKSPKNNINNEIAELTDKVFNAERADSVAARLDSFKNISRTIFVNKGSTHREFKQRLKYFTTTRSLPGSENYDIINNFNTISHDELWAIGEYFRSNYGYKTWRDYLSMVGFDFSNLAGDFRLTYDGACSKGINYYVVGVEYEYYVKSILIDKEIQGSDIDSASIKEMLGVNGVNGFKAESWNYVKIIGAQYATFDLA